MFSAIAIAAFRTQLSYRSQIASGLIAEIAGTFARVSVWTALYASSENSDITLSQMITYAIVGGTILGRWEFQPMLRGIDIALRSGDISLDLIRPRPYLQSIFAVECGRFAYTTVVFALPIVVCSFALGLLTPPPTPYDFALFTLFWAIGFVIFFLIAACLGLLAFWVMTAFTLEWLCEAALPILSGSLIPFWMYPEPLAIVSKVLPFAWIAYYPNLAYLGVFADRDGVLALLGGITWIAILSTGLILLWRKAILRLVIQGG